MIKTMDNEQAIQYKCKYCDETYYSYDKHSKACYKCILKGLDE